MDMMQTKQKLAASQFGMVDMSRRSSAVIAVTAITVRRMPKREDKKGRDRAAGTATNCAPASCRPMNERLILRSLSM